MYITLPVGYTMQAVCILFSNQPGSVMRNNRIEHLIEAPYATNDRAFYIYLDEATDGYTMENNWCPTERFDSNRPGKRTCGRITPQVADSIKYKSWKNKARLKQINGLT